MEWVHERAPEPADEDSDWLYYDPPTSRWHRVLLLAVPESAARVRIQHLDADMKGKAEWVPVKRCRVPWQLSEAYHSTNDAWDRLHGHDPDEPHRLAAEHVVTQLLEPSAAEPALRSAALEISDVREVSRATGISESTLTSHPDTIVEDGVTHVPWPVASQVAQALCERHPDRITEYLAEREREIHQRDIENRANGGAWYEDESFADDRWAKRFRRWNTEDEEKRRILRRWTDGDHPGLSTRYQELRNQHVELTLALLPALDQLSRIRSKKSDQIAEEIRELINRPIP